MWLEWFEVVCYVYSYVIGYVDGRFVFLGMVYMELGGLLNFVLICEVKIDSLKGVVGLFF